MHPIVAILCSAAMTAGFQWGWAAMDRLLESRKRRPIKANYKWKN